MSSTHFKLIAGLGNPGETYSRTRHNIGFLVLDAIAEKAETDFSKTRFDASYTRTTLHGQSVFLVKPISYMNRSGLPLRKLTAYFKIPLTDIIVVHDDMDLPFGVLKIVQDRGSGGHNGIKSIVEAFGSNNFIRVRVGVGHPDAKTCVTGHVLGSFAPEEQAELDNLIQDAADACRCIISCGIVRAMNQVNAKH
ncbi:MAG: aminoacyl-tRNA hydrolase [Desulfotignum sp.]|nr:aminoacyl-tRNA hydrolase [Desulfotignum sp.]